MFLKALAIACRSNMKNEKSKTIDWKHETSSDIANRYFFSFLALAPLCFLVTVK